MSAREAILRRRAQFVSAALVLSGCDRPSSQQAKPVPSVESKVSKPEPPKPAPVKAPPDRPEMTAKVSVTGEAKRAEAAAAIEKIEKAVFEVAGAIPVGCDLNDPVCRSRFKIFAETVAKLREDVYRLSPPHCPPKLADEKAVEAMVSAQRVWLTRWIDDIEKAGRASAEAVADPPEAGRVSGADPGTTWDDLRNEASAAYAHPCLSFACP